MAAVADRPTDPDAHIHATLLVDNGHTRQTTQQRELEEGRIVHRDDVSEDELDWILTHVAAYDECQGQNDQPGDDDPDDATGAGVVDHNFRLRTFFDAFCRDYGSVQAREMVAALWKQDVSISLWSLLYWPGIGTRWKEFVDHVCKESEEHSHSRKDVLRNFATACGRVTTYRALALTEQEYDNILAADCIVPSGEARFKHSEARFKHGSECFSSRRMADNNVRRVGFRGLAETHGLASQRKGW